MTDPAAAPVEQPIRAIVVLLRARTIFEYLNGHRVLANVPADAVCTSVWMHAGRDGTEPLAFALRLEHPSFPETRVGRKIPMVKAVYRRLSQ